MAKKDKIDLSEDRLLDMAASFIEDHNYTAALKMLNKNAGLNYADDRSFMMYAEIYDDIGLHEESINNWFKYLDCCPDPDYGEAYEGLAIGYMHLDNTQFSAFYYNRMLVETEDLSPDARREIIDNFLVREENPLHFAYPPEKADYTAVINEGIEHIRNREPKLAAECFGQVAEGNPKYLLARNYIAMSYILNDMYEEAEAECDHIFSIDPDNVQALTTLAAIRSEQKRYDEAVKIAKDLVAMNVTGQEDIYKIATVCCENKLHEDAYNLLCKLDIEIADTDRNMLYFKAIAAYNCGKYEQCFDTFDTLLALYPDAEVARYYYEQARKNYKKDDSGEFGYFYRLPQDMREQSLTILSAFYSLTDNEARKIADEVDALECIKWCFDETEAAEDNELHVFAALCAVKGGYDDYVRDILLNAFLSDNLKINVLHQLCLRNENNQFGVVICNIYKCIDIYHLDIGRAKRKKFVEAYATIISRFGIIEDSYSRRFASAAERLYDIMENEEALDLCKDSDTLAAVIVTIAKVRGISKNDLDLCNLFDANPRLYDKIMSIIQK